jgi:hypothetical protein
MDGGRPDCKGVFMKVLITGIFMVSVFLSGYSQGSDSTLPKKRIVPWFVERFQFTAGYFHVFNATDIRVEIKGSSGTDINMEKDLDISRNAGTFFADFDWRIASCSRITFSYYNINRSATHTLEKNIVFEDNTYPVNAAVNTYFNTAIYHFSYGYAFLSKPKFELGMLIGVHVMSTKTGISLSGAAGAASKTNNFGFTAPIPDLGIWGGYAFTSRFAVNFNLEYFSLTINSITGRVIASNLTLTYRIVEKLDLSMGYAFLDFKVDAVKQGAEGLFKWGYNGPAIALNYSFGKRSWGH